VSYLIQPPAMGRKIATKNCFGDKNKLAFLTCHVLLLNHAGVIRGEPGTKVFRP
jgi:hypothetical protein